MLCIYVGPSGLGSGLSGSSGPGPSGLRSSGSGLEIRSSCNRALQVVRNVRDHLRGTRAADEQKVNFAPYKIGKKRNIESACLPPAKKCTAWSAKFVCLADTGAQHVPTTVTQKEVLVEAGLGEKKVDIPDIDCSASEFQQQLMNVFPKLKHAGGFELLRCISNSKMLELLSPSISTSPRLLRSVVGKSHIFIRPIQRDIDLDATVEGDLPEKVCASYLESGS